LNPFAMAGRNGNKGGRWPEVTARSDI